MAGVASAPPFPLPRALAARLDEALAEGEALRQELAALSGRHEAKVSECEAVRDAKAQLERESADAIAALDVRAGWMAWAAARGGVGYSRLAS